MSDGEQLVAECTVPVERQGQLTVRISQHAQEDFWRVDFAHSSYGGSHLSTTVAGDSFMMDLIQGAMSGEPVAWRHLAHWGQENLLRPGRVGGLSLA